MGSLPRVCFGFIPINFVHVPFVALAALQVVRGRDSRAKTSPHEWSAPARPRAPPSDAQPFPQEIANHA